MFVSPHRQKLSRSSSTTFAQGCQTNLPARKHNVCCSTLLYYISLLFPWFGNFRSKWKFSLESSCSDNSADHHGLTMFICTYIMYTWAVGFHYPAGPAAVECRCRWKSVECVAFLPGMNTGYLVFWTIFLWANDTQSIKYIRCRLWIYFLLNGYKQIILCFCAHNLQCLCVYLSAWCILYLS